jgi:hypothetical protein
MITLLFDRIVINMINPIYSIFLCGTLLPVSFPSMFDLGESLKECKGDLFPVGKFLNREITF